MNTQIENSFITIPLGITAHQYAQQFAKLQASFEKATQAYHNTLTIYAAHCYLKYLEIESDLEQSEGWNLAISTLQDTASLYLPEFGDLECRLVHSRDESIDLPSYAKDDKIGLLVFRVGDMDVTQIEEMKVIGFVENLSQLPLDITQLPPTSRLFDRLELMQLLMPVRVYIPDLSIDLIKAELELIYQKSDDLRFEYEISKFLKQGQERMKFKVDWWNTPKGSREVSDRCYEVSPTREQVDNSDQELQALAAELAEQLQDLWGQLN
jgi:Protein of unknown function (DUF1822)